jgi:serine protease DegQ
VEDGRSRYSPAMSQPNESSNIQHRALELSDLLASAVETAGGSVVQVSARRGIGSSGIVWSADGVVVAADHNVQREDEITVGLPDGSTVPARLAGRDPSTDLAVLRVEASGLATPEWSDLADARVGHLVLGLLRPGSSVRATLGIVSALGGEWRTPAGGRIERYVQTDLAILKGFSGSLVVDARGRALGLGTAGLLRGHALAVPRETLSRVVEALLAHGRIPRGFLGVGLMPVLLPTAIAESVGGRIGLMVVSVQPDSAAERGDIRLGDVLVAFEGQPLGDLGQLHALMSERVGAEVTLRVSRAGELRDVRVVLAAR